jgi:hypothetical protein
VLLPLPLVLRLRHLLQGLVILIQASGSLLLTLLLRQRRVVSDLGLQAQAT